MCSVSSDVLSVFPCSCVSAIGVIDSVGGPGGARVAVQDAHISDKVTFARLSPDTSHHVLSSTAVRKNTPAVRALTEMSDEASEWV